MKQNSHVSLKYIKKINLVLFFSVLFFSSEALYAGKVFGGIGADYLNPRTERSDNGNTSFSTGSEFSMQYHGTLGYQFDRKKRHSLKGTYIQKNFEYNVPSGRAFTETEYSWSSFKATYTYSKQSYEFYLDYLQDSTIAINDSNTISIFEITPIGTTFVGLGFRLKAYSDKPHNLFSYQRYRGYRDSHNSKVSYSKGFRLSLDFAYYHQLSSETFNNAEVEYTSKLFAGLQIEKGGVFNIGARINFFSEEYDYAAQKYTVIDFGAGVFIKFNY